MDMGLLLHRCGDDDRHGDSVSYVVMFQMKNVQMEPNPEGAVSANRQQKNPDAVFGLFAA